MSADIIPFVPRSRARRTGETTAPLRSPARADDLVMDRADTAPCEYLPWRNADDADHEPA